MFDLTDRIALVTGASSGIGRATVIALAKQGARVAAAARRIDKLQSLAEEYNAKGLNILPVPMDVTKYDEINAGIDAIVSKWEKLDILVNNAGTITSSSLMEMTEETWNTVINTNLKGYAFVAQKAAREMEKNKWGRIINISSVLSGGIGRAQPEISAFCASKAGVIGLTESMALELAPLGILVNAISPGFIDTEMNKNIMENPQMFQSVIEKLPLKRFGKPEEIAAAIVFFASQEASYLTGSTLYVDGGWLAA